MEAEEKGWKENHRSVVQSQPAPTGEYWFVFLMTGQYMTSPFWRDLLTDNYTTKTNSSHLHEHIIACPRVGGDEVPPVATRVAALVGPLPPGPVLSNQTQIHPCPGWLLLLSKSTKKCLPRKECRQELQTCQVLQKFSDLHLQSKIGVLAVKVAKQALYPKSWHNMPTLSRAVLDMHEETLFMKFPGIWRTWIIAQETIVQACKWLGE